VSEEEKEEQKKKKSQLIASNLAIQNSLSEAIRASATLQSVFIDQASAVQFKAPDWIRQTASNLQTMLSFSNAITSAIQQQQTTMRALHAFQAPLVSRTMFQYQTQIRALSEGLVRINRMMQMPKIDIPVIKTELHTLPSHNNKTIDILLRYIDSLEKELVKEKAMNKELLRLLEDIKKKVKQQYIA
jgi:predicted RNase H-like nuclease (RuvC/YqgF family)